MWESLVDISDDPFDRAHARRTHAYDRCPRHNGPGDDPMTLRESGGLARKIASPSTRLRTGEAGFSYVEVLLATLIMTLALAPAIDGLMTGTLGASVHLEMAEEHFHVASLIEEILAQPFDRLDAEAVLVGSPLIATALCDAPGGARRRLVHLARYDGDELWSSSAGNACDCAGAWLYVA